MSVFQPVQGDIGINVVLDKFESKTDNFMFGAYNIVGTAVTVRLIIPLTDLCFVRSVFALQFDCARQSIK